MTKWAHTPIAGCDFTVNNVMLVKTDIKKQACNALLLKACQFAAVPSSAFTGSHMVCGLRDEDQNLNVKCSRFPDKAEDTVFADLIIGGCLEQNKFGALCHSGRNAKYHQLENIKEKPNGECIQACIDQCTPRWMHACPFKVDRSALHAKVVNFITMAWVSCSLLPPTFSLLCPSGGVGVDRVQ